MSCVLSSQLGSAATEAIKVFDLRRELGANNVHVDLGCQMNLGKPPP